MKGEGLRRGSFRGRGYGFIFGLIDGLFMLLRSRGLYVSLGFFELLEVLCRWSIFFFI